MFWSPDGQWLGYFDTDARKLKKVSVEGGAPQALADVARPGGGTWNRDGIILYSGDNARAIMKIPSIGGSPTPLIQTQGLGGRGPTFLPDNVHFAFIAATSPAKTYIGSLASDQTGRASRRPLAGLVRQWT
jgi:hypothetical protein